MLLPDRYDGASPWADYLTHFESVASVNKWSKAEKAGYLASHLRGLAQEAFADLSLEARKDYVSVLEHFERRFGVASQVPLHRAQLSMRVRGRGESLEELGRSIRRLVLRSYPTFPASVREDLAVEAFRNALGEEQLQRHVFAGKASSGPEMSGWSGKPPLVRRAETQPCQAPPRKSDATDATSLDISAGIAPWEGAGRCRPGLAAS